MKKKKTPKKLINYNGMVWGKVFVIVEKKIWKQNLSLGAEGFLVRIEQEDTAVVVIIKVTNSQVHWRM